MPNLFAPALEVRFKDEAPIFCYHSYFNTEDTANIVLRNMLSEAQSIPGLKVVNSYVDQRSEYYAPDVFTFDVLMEHFCAAQTSQSLRWVARIEEEDYVANWFTYTPNDPAEQVTPDVVATRAFEHWESNGVYRDQPHFLYRCGDDWVRSHEGPPVIVTAPDGTLHKVQLWMSWHPRPYTVNTKTEAPK